MKAQRALLLVFLVALTVRLAAAAWTGLGGEPAGDERGYTLLAQSLARTGALEPSNGMLVAQDTQQKAMIEQLERENFELTSGARWPEWITGAAILGIGMLMGAILQSVSGRRQRPRIRL